MIFLGFLLALFMLVASVVPYDPNLLWIYFNVRSTILTLVGITGYILFFGRKEFLRGIKSIFVFSFPLDEESINAGQFFQRLSLFTVLWGLLCAIISFAWLMVTFDLHAFVRSMSFILTSFLYGITLTVFLFLPIGLRLSPLTSSVASQRLTIRLSLTGIVMFFLIRFWIFISMLSYQTPDRQEPINIYEFGQVMHLTLFAYNPMDPLGNSLLFSVIQMIVWRIDLLSLIFVLFGWWVFRLASGKRRRWIATPILIFIGLLGSIIGITLSFANFSPESIAASLMISMVTTLYALIGAAGFLIADMRSSFRTPPPNPPAEGTEQAKAIIDRVVESERR